MPTTFSDGSSIKREIKVTGIEQPILVEINASGLEFWAKGSRKKVRLSWSQAVRAGETGNDVLSFLQGRPVELLTHYADRKQKQ